MIEIRFSAPYELDISGTVDELETVRQRILQLVEAGDQQIMVEADASIDPAPYDAALQRLLIAKGDCPTKISLRNKEEILIEGTADTLGVLASFFIFDDDAPDGDHSHYEHYEGNEWIDPDSIPLVISVK
jgi:hypothetical protein